MTASQLVQITGYQHQEFITHDHYIITDYNFLSPTVQNLGKNRPKTRQNRPKPRRKTSILNPLSALRKQCGRAFRRWQLTAPR